MKFKAYSFAALIIFGTGVTAGGLWGNRLHPAKSGPLRRQSLVSENHKASVPPPEVLSQPFFQRLDENLHLTPGQSAAIQKIMSEDQNQMRKVVQDSRLEIREALTPSQREKFDSLVKRRFHKPIFATNGPPSLTAASQ